MGVGVHRHLLLALSLSLSWTLSDTIAPFLRDAALLRRQLAATARMIPPKVKLAVVIKNVERPIAVAELLQKFGEEDPHLHVEAIMVPDMKSALAMRDAGIKGRVVCMYTVHPEEALELARRDVEVAINSLWWLRAYRAAATKAGTAAPPLKVHLFVDTGLGRQGGLPEEMLEVAKEIPTRAGAGAQVIIVGVMTHLCCEAYESNAGEFSDKWFYATVFGAKGSKGMQWRARTIGQLDTFDRFLASARAQNLIPPGALVHAASSGPVKNGVSRSFYDMVRVGRMVVDGTSSLHDAEALFFMAAEEAEKGGCVKPWIVAKKKLPAGYCVGYGCEAIAGLQKIAGPLKDPSTNVILLGGDCIESTTGTLLPSAVNCTEKARAAHGWRKDQVDIILGHGNGGSVAVVKDPHLFETIQPGTAVAVCDK